MNAPEIVAPLLTLLAKVTLTLCLALLCRLLMLRHFAAAARHTMLLCGLSIVFLLPLSLLFPEKAAYNVAVPMFVRVSAVPAASQERREPKGDDVGAGLAPALPDSAPALVSRAGTTPASGRPAPTPIIAVPLSEGVKTGIARDEQRRPLSVSAPVSVLSFSSVSLCISMLYGAGVLMTLGRFAASFWFVHRLSGRAAAGDSAEMAFACQRMGITRPIASLVSRDISVPMMFGWRNPTILLPSEAGDWPADRRRAALLHEAAHISRHDWPVLVFARLVCAAYWFHPLIWLVAAHLRTEAEQAADDCVLLAGIPAPDYARHLLEIARSLSCARRPAPQAAVAIAERTHMEIRLRALLDAARMRRVPRGTPVALVVAAVVLGGLLVPLRPQAQAQTPVATSKITPKSEPKTQSAPTTNAAVATHLQAIEAQINRLQVERDTLRRRLNGGRPDANENAARTSDLELVKRQMAELQARRQQVDRSIATAHFLDKRIQEYRARMMQAENALAKYRTDHFGQMPAAQQGLIERLSQLKQELDDLTITTGGTDKQIQFIESRIARLSPDVVIERTFGKSENAQKIEELVVQRRAAIASGERPDGATVRDINRQIRSYTGYLQKESKEMGIAGVGGMTSVQGVKVVNNPAYDNLEQKLNDARIVAAMQQGRMKLLKESIARLEIALQAKPQSSSRKSSMKKGK